MADWAVGDLALCVRSIWASRPGDTVPRSGQVGLVERVTQGANHRGLVLREFQTSNKFGWAAFAFVKITPGTEIEGVEAENRIRENA